MGARVVTAREMLDGHAALDIECLDRVYLNAYVPVLQSSGQVVAFMTQHLGLPIPSPAIFDKMGQRFRRAVASFADANHIPWVRFAKEDRKADVMRPYLDRQAATGRSGVAAIGVAQEFQRVWAAYRRETRTAAPQFTFAKADRRVTCYYFYLWDEGFGPAFIKVCAYFPYPAKIWVNGHEWAKRQAARAGLGYRELSNGFAACDDAAALQAICDRLGPGTIEAFAQRWLHRLPLPFGPDDQRAGYWWELSMRQVEVSRTIVLDAPRRARAFFEALIADNLDIGRPANVEIIFRRHIRRDTPGIFRTAIDRPAVGPDTAIRIDANGAWGVEQAIASLRELEPLGIDCCEEPVSGALAIARVAAETAIPIALDETTAEPGALDRCVCQVACLKVARLGGITGLLEAARRARRAGYELYLASMLDGPLGIAAALHAAAVIRPERPCGLATLSLFEGRTDPIPAVDGRMTAPSGPGLGDGLLGWYGTLGH